MDLPTNPGAPHARLAGKSGLVARLGGFIDGIDGTWSSQAPLIPMLVGVRADTPKHARDPHFKASLIPRGSNAWYICLHSASTLSETTLASIDPMYPNFEVIQLDRSY